MESYAVNKLQLDALKEIGNIAAGNAATAFSQMVSRRVGMSVPQARIASIAELKNVFSEEEINIGVYQRVLGEASGNILMVLSRASAFELIDIVSPKEYIKPRILTAANEDMLMELANIVAGSYLTTLSRMTGILFMPSVPRLTVDLTRLMLEYLLELNPQLRVAFVIFNELKVEESTISLELLLLPDPNALPTILKAIGAQG